MPKTMAIVENGVVTNTIWCNDETEESDELKEVYERKVQIGDQYIDGIFYRNGKVVLSAVQELEYALFDAHERIENSYTEEELVEMYNDGVNSI